MSIEKTAHCPVKGCTDPSASHREDCCQELRALCARHRKAASDAIGKGRCALAAVADYLDEGPHPTGRKRDTSAAPKCSKCSERPAGKVQRRGKRRTPAGQETWCAGCRRRENGRRRHRVHAAQAVAPSRRSAPKPEVLAPGLDEPGPGDVLRQVERALTVVQALGGIARAERIAAALGGDHG